MYGPTYKTQKEDIWQEVYFSDLQVSYPMTNIIKGQYMVLKVI